MLEGGGEGGEKGGRGPVGLQERSPSKFSLRSPVFFRRKKKLGGKAKKGKEGASEFPPCS